MSKKYEELTIHQKLESLISDMVDKEIHLKEALIEFEKIYIETASGKYNGNKSKMSQALGIHRNTLHNRFKALKIKQKK
ncbi:MAG: helix-turn-helix domain-containing protein [Acidobacteriota bacterium]|nr:helix-turn-helix domain-containing protein [Acidobacteriota bacterium]MDW3229699.1 helix-turn-helix domain-containing protein [Acidobacteriota bacterium]